MALQPMRPTHPRNNNSLPSVLAAFDPNMARPYLYLPALVSLLALVLGGCGNQGLGGSAEEGTVEYAMSFPEMPPNGLMANMLPEKAVLSFNRDHQSMDLSAGMGVFRTSMVVNTQAQVVDYHMSVMGKNLVAAFKRRDLVSLNKTEAPLSVLLTSARDTIAGLPCKQAYLIYGTMGTPEAEVWYTDVLDPETPNWYSPFNDIPGVLMRYEVVQHNIRMRMEATKVTLGPVDPAIFEKRKEHQEVSPEVFHAQLDDVLGAFNN